MSKQERYFIGPGLLGDIRSTIQRVDAIAPRSSGPASDAVHQELSRRTGGLWSLRLGKTTATWTKGTVASIELYEEGTPPSETRNASDYTLADCVNKFANVAGGKWVMVAKMKNGRWYLIAAEC